MSRDMSPRRAPTKKTSRGGTLVGMFVGLVLGIVGAAAVVWYINKMPTPFKPSAPPPEQAKVPADGPAPLPGKPGDPVPEKRFQFYDILPGKAEAKVDGSAPPAADGKERKDGKDSKDGKEARDGKDVAKETIFLQAGSFLNAGDADNQKAKLALMGMEASIQQVMVQDKTFFRVRLGPYGKVEEVNKVRAELAKQGIEAALVKKD